jgi:hypothetical protein
MTDLLLTAGVFILALIALIILLRLVQTFLLHRSDAAAPVRQPGNTADAAGVLAAAQAQAEKIVREAHIVTRRTEQDLQHHLAAQTKQATAAAEEQVQEMTAKLAAAVEEHLQGISARLTKHTAALEKELVEIDERERARIRKELVVWEQRRRSALENKINAVLPQLVAEAAGQAIPLEEHEKLVRDALQRAAQEGWK